MAAKRLVVITGINIITVLLFVLFLSGVLFALGVLAPQITIWPLVVLPLVSFALSIVALRTARRAKDLPFTWIAYVLNGVALLFDVLVLGGIASIFWTTTKEQFFIPQGYKGDVYIVHDAAGAPSERRGRSVVYRIPNTGVFFTQSTEPELTRPEYYYFEPNGTFQQIDHFWPTTIHRTKENLENDTDVGIFFPRSGQTNTSEGCSARYRQFYVGTKAHLLSAYKELDLAAHLKGRPSSCRPDNMRP